MIKFNSLFHILNRNKKKRRRSRNNVLKMKKQNLINYKFNMN